MVYRGGLENRCGFTPTGGSNPSPSAKAFVRQFYIQLLVWVVVVGVVFGFLWKSGYLAKLSAYVLSVRDELRKCSWPSREELWQTTMLILTIIGILGVFTLVSDFVVLKFVRAIL